MSLHWYIIQTHSGCEEKVRQAVAEKAAQRGLSKKIEQIVVPTEEVLEVRKGQKVNAERKILPGYIMARMELDDSVWHLIKEIPKVAGFLGGKGRPQPISDAEAGRIFKQMEEGTRSSHSGAVFEIGESVKITDGPFESFVGVIEDLDAKNNKLKVAVSIFGRSTPVELEYGQVEKVTS